MKTATAPHGFFDDKLTTAWRRNNFVQPHVLYDDGNYGTAGSQAAWAKYHQHYRVIPSVGPTGQDPRVRKWNGIWPIVWIVRVVNQGELDAISAKAPVPLPAPVNFTPPDTASLLSGQGYTNARSLLL